MAGVYRTAVQQLVPHRDLLSTDAGRTTQSTVPKRCDKSRALESASTMRCPSSADFDAVERQQQFCKQVVQQRDAEHLNSEQVAWLEPFSVRQLAATPTTTCSTGDDDDDDVLSTARSPLDTETGSSLGFVAAEHRGQQVGAVQRRRDACKLLLQHNCGRLAEMVQMLADGEEDRARGVGMPSDTDRAGVEALCSELVAALAAAEAERLANEERCRQLERTVSQLQKELHVTHALNRNIWESNKTRDMDKKVVKRDAFGVSELVQCVAATGVALMMMRLRHVLLR